MGKIAGIKKVNIHSITRALAIRLMLFQSILATIILVCKQEDMIRGFHKFNLFVWVV
jgi:hypothetical protein